jgi:hypothetical protein
MIQVRTTLLESFRRFRDGVTETYDNEQLMIEKLSGEFIGNNKTEIGSAFHFLIEHTLMTVENVKEFQKFGVAFSEKQQEQAYLHSYNLQPFIPEVRQSKVFQIKYGEISITGAMDVLQGNTIRDTKCKFRSPEYLEYYNSFQWRIYLSIFELNRFLYDIFEFIGYDDKMGKDVSSIELKQHEPFECLRYENMETDIIILLNDFMEWIEFRNLKHLLTNI